MLAIDGEGTTSVQSMESEGQGLLNHRINYDNTSRTETMAHRTTESFYPPTNWTKKKAKKTPKEKKFQL